MKIMFKLKVREKLICFGAPETRAIYESQGVLGDGAEKYPPGTMDTCCCRVGYPGYSG